MIELLLIAITAFLFRPIVRTVKRCQQSFLENSGGARKPVLIFAGGLLVLACLAYCLTVLTLLSAVWRSLSPGPEPFILLPWFIGITVTTLPWFFADGLINILNKDEKPLM